MSNELIAQMGAVTIIMLIVIVIMLFRHWGVIGKTPLKLSYRRGGKARVATAKEGIVVVNNAKITAGGVLAKVNSFVGPRTIYLKDSELFPLYPTRCLFGKGLWVQEGADYALPEAEKSMVQQQKAFRNRQLESESSLKRVTIAQSNADAVYDNYEFAANDIAMQLDRITKTTKDLMQAGKEDRKKGI